nr:VP3 protein [Rotavirus J]
MAKVIVRTRNEGYKIESHEDIFKISNKLETEIIVNCTDYIFEKIKQQTFYVTIDKTSAKGNDAYERYSQIFPTPIFSDNEENYLFGTCRHIISNTLHYTNELFIPYESVINDLLPAGWKAEYINSDDYPIGNDVIPNYFDNISNISVAKFLQFSDRFDNKLPEMRVDHRLKESILNDCLAYVYAPAIDYDVQSYNYRITRREIGNKVRDLVFNMCKGKMHLIGPELESVRNVVQYLNMKGNTIKFYTLNTTKKLDYDSEKRSLQKKRLKFSNLLAPQRKNQNNFVKGLIHHLNKSSATVDRVYYIGAYPSYWLENMKWINFQIVCYDPKFRLVDNPNVLWRDKLFSEEDVENVESGSYVYIDIRSDIRTQSDAVKNKIFKDEDDMILELTRKLVKKGCTVMAKRKIVEQSIVSIGEECYPPGENQIGREFYNLADASSVEKLLTRKEVFAKIVNARSNNKQNYVYGGTKFDSSTIIEDNEIVIGLYSLSNSFNSLATIEHVIKSNHVITFPTDREHGDWRDISKAQSKPFVGKIKQLNFEDWAVNPKAYCKKYNVEMLAEQVFLQYGNTRAFIPDLYCHMVSTNMAEKLKYSDRFFAHIGIRQPSIYARDKYMTSRISAYISRKLTHGIDLRDLERDNFAGYSGHLIAIETSFNSLVYTMSPLRWIQRAQRRETRKDKFQIGKGEPHTEEEYKNTYDYLDDHNKQIIDFRTELL